MTTQVAAAWNFEHVYNTYRQRIYARIYTLVQDRELAEDLMQDTFLRAFKALPKIQGELNMSAWLYRIATNIAFDALRHRQLIRWTTIEEWLDEPPSSTSDDPQNRYSGPLEFIRLALKDMPAPYRRALLLSIQEGYSYAQIAQELGIAPGGARMYLTRARRSLRRHYTELEREEAHV